MLDLFSGLFKTRKSDEFVAPEPAIIDPPGSNSLPLNNSTISVKCIPVRCNRDAREKASQPFLFKTVGVPHLHDFIAMSFGHFNKETGRGEMRQHTYQVERVLRKENGIELQVIEEPMLMKVLS
jgi:hypothetical protein